MTPSGAWDGWRGIGVTKWQYNGPGNPWHLVKAGQKEPLLEITRRPAVRIPIGPWLFIMGVLILAAACDVAA